MGLQVNSTRVEIIFTQDNKWDKFAGYLLECMYACTHTCIYVCIRTGTLTNTYVCGSTCTLVCSQHCPRKGQETLPSSLQVSTLLESLTQSLDWLQSVRSGLVPREGPERVCLGYHSLVITCCRGQPQGSLCQDEARWGRLHPACWCLPSITPTGQKPKEMGRR